MQIEARSAGPKPDTERRLDTGFIGAVAGAILLGLAVRLSFVAASDFPLHDGGLFYAMVRDLQRVHYALPRFTSYNEAGLPFAYPPLGFYLAGLLDDLTPLSLLDIFRFLPMIVNLGALAAFALLARSLLRSRTAAIGAVFAFALLPMGFQWQITGGGLTRSLGLVFALLTIYYVHRMYTRPGSGFIFVPVVLLAACTILSHPDMAWFAAYSSGILFLAYGRTRAGVARSLLVALGTTALTAPWWLTIVLRFGLSPFASAGTYGWPAPYAMLARLVLSWPTYETFFPALGLLAFLGALVCLRERRFLLPVWLVAVFVLDARTLLAKTAVVFALLAGIGMAGALLPILSPGDRPPASPEPGGIAVRGARRRPLVAAVLALVLIQATLSAVVGYRSLLRGLSPAERQAMGWIAGHTPAAATFLVVTPEWWAEDRSSEWFPALTGRESVLTVQGYEWAGAAVFMRRSRQSEALKACATADAGCLEAWRQETGVVFDYVYVPVRPVDGPAGQVHDRLATLRSTLRSDSRYGVVYDGPGATVFARIGAS